PRPRDILPEPNARDASAAMCRPAVARAAIGPRLPQKRHRSTVRVRATKVRAGRAGTTSRAGEQARSGRGQVRRGLTELRKWELRISNCEFRIVDWEDSQLGRRNL